MKESSADSSASAKRTVETSEGVSRLAQERVCEFVSTLGLDEDDESIDGIENLPRFMERIASIASDTSVPLPVIFEGGHGSVGLMWSREQGNCYLYAELNSMEAQWVERRNGERRRTEHLDMDMGRLAKGWKTLERNLQAAYTE